MPEFLGTTNAEAIAKGQSPTEGDLLPVSEAEREAARGDQPTGNDRPVEEGLRGPGRTIREVADRDLAATAETLKQVAAEIAGHLAELRAGGAPAAAEESAALEDLRVHALYTADQIDEMRAGSPGQPPARAAGIVASLNACQADADAGKRKFGGGCWDRLLDRVGENVPWLMAALTVKSEVREWSAAASIKVPGLAEVAFTVTYGVVRSEAHRPPA